MDAAIVVLGWVVWAFFFIQGMGMILSRYPDPGLATMMKFSGFLIQAGCLVTAFHPISKFHLIWWYFATFLATKLWLRFRLNSTLGQFASDLQKESEKTGVPLIELLERENKRMKE